MIDDIMGFIKYCQQTAKQLRLIQQQQQQQQLKLSKPLKTFKFTILKQARIFGYHYAIACVNSAVNWLFIENIQFVLISYLHRRRVCDFVCVQ